jgi:carbamoyltransferase
MRILGITDSHDAGVCLLENGKIVYAANEERFSRKKLHWGFPTLSLKNLFEYTKISPSSIDQVAIASLGMVEQAETTGFGEGNVGLFRRTMEQSSKLMGPVLATKGITKLMRGSLQLSRKNKDFTKSFLKRMGVHAPITYLDHHLCHAASAYYTFGYKDALVITADGGGDGLSGSVWAAHNNIMQQIASCPKIHSIGNFWDYITFICGFNPARHGGKITGLAAYQPAPDLYEQIRKYYGYSKKDLHFLNKKHLFWRESVKFLQQQFKGRSIQEISYAAQKVLEENMTGIVQEAVHKTGLSKVCFAGGTFANVRLNQKILELSNVDEIFIHPHMGDGGLAVGAAFALSSQRTETKPYSLTDVFFGPDFSREDIIAACEKHKVNFVKVKKVADLQADLLVKKNVLGMYHGRMEYGPRALGHRTIAAEPTDVTMMDWLNERLVRTEFMPFAPIIREEDAPQYFKKFEEGKYPARFMTLCFDVTPLARKKAQGIVHKDGTARPQTLNKNVNKEFHALLTAYNKKKGLPLSINTSFNKHEEPIVCRPEDAVQEFLRGAVDHLFLEDYHIFKE